MNELVTVTKIYQRTQIVGKTHQNLQRKKCPRMSVPNKDSLPNRQQQQKIQI